MAFTIHGLMAQTVPFGWQSLAEQAPAERQDVCKSLLLEFSPSGS